MDAVGGIALIIVAYLLGAIPWGVVLGRVFAGVDVREHGSQSTGATNALRVLGKKFSIAVLILDMAKGILPVVVGRVVGLPEWAIGIAAVAAVVGHCWSPYIGFSGGKGVATGGGAAVALFPWLLILFPVMIVIVYLTRYVSLASIVAAVIGAIVAIVTAALGGLPWWWGIAIGVIAAIMLERHKGNISRLRSGNENKFGARVTPRAETP
ncbi:MAG TPA: glycerol-3-phosphate 1-O-acyltransferase PlsY [Thermomicrobiales bacterium]|nr:glycerol-3-phosphate 1-O-acyltransferase PlsY [Thermomicrobiales bacterium]